MPLDSSIITNMQQPDFSQAISTGINMKAMATQNQMNSIKAQEAKQQFSDSNALRTAKDNNTTVDPDTGNVTMDHAGYMKDLTAAAPHLAQQAQMEYIGQQRASQEANIKNLNDQHSAIANLASSATDQPTWDAAIAKANSLGIPTDQVPKQFDPQVRNNLIMSSMNAKDQLAAQAEQQGLDIKKQQAKIDSAKLGVEMFKTYGAPGTGTGTQSKGSSPVDPSTLVPRSVPPDRQKQVFDEIGAAQNTAKSAPQILAAFDRAAQNRHMADFIPGVDNADQKAMHALMGPTFQDVEGTVRQAAMDNMAHNTTPQALDNDNTIKTKRASLVGYLTSKSAAPTAKGFGIDLSKYPSTSLDPRVIAGNDKPSDSHKDFSIGTVSNGYVKTKNGWVPKEGELNASK